MTKCKSLFMGRAVYVEGDQRIAEAFDRVMEAQQKETQKLRELSLDARMWRLSPTTSTETVVKQAMLLCGVYTAIMVGTMVVLFFVFG